MNHQKLATAAMALVAITISGMSTSSQAATKDLYPGSMCTFERQGTGGTINKRQGTTGTSARTGTVVTCPVPVPVGNGDSPVTDYTASVQIRYDHGNPDLPAAQCHRRSSYSHNGGIHSEDSLVQSERNFGRVTYFFEDGSLRSLASLVIRCWIPQDVTIETYSLQTR